MMVLAIYNKFKSFVENLHQMATSGQITWHEFNTRLEEASAQTQQDMHIITKRQDDGVGEFWIASVEDAPEICGGGETKREAFLDVMKKVVRLPQPDYEQIQAVYPEWRSGE